LSNQFSSPAFLLLLELDSTAVAQLRDGDGWGELWRVRSLKWTLAAGVVRL